MNLSCGLSLYVAQTTTQKLKQMQTLKLRQELRQLLRQLIEILTAIIQQQTIHVAQLRTIEDLVAKVPQTDFRDFAHELVRREGLNAADDLLQVFHCIGRWQTDLGLPNIQLFVRDFEYVVDNEVDRRRTWHGTRMRLALCLILQNPHFLGGRGGSEDALHELLLTCPQRDRRDNLLWILTGGWAVRLLCPGHKREQQDIDTLVVTKRPLCLDTDTVFHAGEYLGDMNLNRRTVVDRCVRVVQWTHEASQTTHTVDVACPEYLFFSKFIRQPLEKDWEDIQEIVRQHLICFDLRLMRHLSSRNTCGFTGWKQLRECLKKRDPEETIAALQLLWREIHRS